MDVRVAGDDVVFFADGAVVSKGGVHGRVEVLRNARGVGMIAECFEARGGNPVRGRPSIGFIPLHAGVEVTHG